MNNQQRFDKAQHTNPESAYHKGHNNDIFKNKSPFVVSVCLQSFQYPISVIYEWMMAFVNKSIRQVIEMNRILLCVCVSVLKIQYAVKMSSSSIIHKTATVLELEILIDIQVFCILKQIHTIQSVIDTSCFYPMFFSLTTNENDNKKTKHDN